MANWSQVKVEDVKVVSHERVEDTNPDTYCERGEYFFQQGKFAEAESEYAKAVKLSNFDSNYIEKLIKFYYGTESKEYEKKANKLYKAWYKKAHGSNIYISRCIYSLYLAYVGLSGNIFASLFMLLVYSGIFFVSSPKKLFIHTARHKMGSYIVKSVIALIFAVVTCFIGCMVIYEGGELVNTIYDFEQSDVVVYVGKIVGVIAAVFGIIYCNKFISHLQSSLKNPNGFWKKFLQAARIVASAVIIFVAGALMYQSMYEWNRAKYEESHDGWLTEQELKKLEKLEEKYDKLTETDIRYFQRIEGDSNTQLEYEGSYVYLVYSSMGMSFEMGDRSLYSNILTGDILKKFADEVSEIYDADYTDYEECEKYFELAYQYVRNMDLPEIDSNTPTDSGEGNMGDEDAELNDDVNSMGMNSEVETNPQADTGNSVEYWDMTTQQIYDFLKEKSTLEEIEEEIGTDMSVKYDYTDLRIGKFYAKAGAYTGEVSYSQMFSEEFCNSFHWYCDQPLTESIICRAFGVEEYGEAYDPQKFLWKNKMELTVFYEEDSTRIIFNLYNPEKVAESEAITDYLALTEDEQKAYIASVLNGKEEYFLYYNIGIVNEEIVSMYEYEDEAGAADCLIILFRDGTIATYYSEDNWTPLN